MKLRLGDKIFLLWGGFSFVSWLAFTYDLTDFIVGFLVFVVLPWYIYRWISNRKLKLKTKNAIQHN